MHKQAHSERLISTPPGIMAHAYAVHMDQLSETDRSVCNIIAAAHNIPDWMMFADTRKHPVPLARHIYAYWMGKRTLRKPGDIGRLYCLGGRDRTTVLHSFDTAKALIETDGFYRAIWNRIRTIYAPVEIEAESATHDPAWVKTKVDNRHLIAKCE